MSRPRAATSVATSTRALPDLNSLSAFWRCAWLLLPWIATACRPAFSSCSARRLQPCLVLPNTSTCSVWRLARMSISRSRLRAPSTGCARWRDGLGDGVLRGDLHLLRVAHELQRQLLDAAPRTSPRTAASGACDGTRAEDALDRRQEAHVEHAVGFVQDQQFDGVEVGGAALEVVDQAARAWRRGCRRRDAARRSAAACRRRRRSW